MFDRYLHALMQPILQPIVKGCARYRMHPNSISFIGFFFGLLSVPLLAIRWYILALFVILINRFLDGLDGALARVTKVSDRGGFLDITFDFIFYAAVVLGFTLGNPKENALSAVFLLFTFIAAMCSFLAYAIMNVKRKNNISVTHKKSFHYLGGITEGFETILFFVIICLVPDWFPPLAYVYGVLCLVTAFGRVCTGYAVFR